VLHGSGKDRKVDATMHWAIGGRVVFGRKAGPYDSRWLEVETGKKWSTTVVGRSAQALDLASLNRTQ